MMRILSLIALVAGASAVPSSYQTPVPYDPPTAPMPAATVLPIAENIVIGGSGPGDAAPWRSTLSVYYHQIVSWLLCDSPVATYAGSVLPSTTSAYTFEALTSVLSPLAEITCQKRCEHPVPKVIAQGDPRFILPGLAAFLEPQLAGTPCARLADGTFPLEVPGLECVANDFPWLTIKFNFWGTIGSEYGDVVFPDYGKKYPVNGDYMYETSSDDYVRTGDVVERAAPDLKGHMDCVFSLTALGEYRVPIPFSSDVGGPSVHLPATTWYQFSMAYENAVCEVDELTDDVVNSMEAAVVDFFGPSVANLLDGDRCEYPTKKYRNWTLR